MTTEKREIAKRFKWLNELLAAGELVRGKDQSEADVEAGRVSLLEAISPEDFASWGLPKWFIRRLHLIDDDGSEQAWPAMIKRFIDVVGKAALVIDADGWERVKSNIVPWTNVPWTNETSWDNITTGILDAIELETEYKETTK